MVNMINTEFPILTPLTHLLHKMSGGTIEVAKYSWFQQFWAQLRGRELPTHKLDYPDPPQTIDWIEKDGM